MAWAEDLRMSKTNKVLRIRQVRNALGRNKVQKRTLEALGIRRLNQEVIHSDSPQMRGMIRRVSHLVEVVEESV